jgi:hypothetical protein
MQQLRQQSAGPHLLSLPKSDKPISQGHCGNVIHNTCANTIMLEENRRSSPRFPILSTKRPMNGVNTADIKYGIV